MKTLGNAITRTLVLALAFAPCSAFAFDLFGSKSVIWEASANEYIKYAEQDSARSGGNDHPAKLPEKEIVAVLQSLELANGKGSVFTNQQAELLGKQLASGLSSAKPDQDIVFALKRTESRLIGTKPYEYFVAGRAFYEDGRLNVIIGDYDRLRNDAYEAAVDPTHQGIVRYNFDHGRRAERSRSFTSAVAKVDGVDNAPGRDDWFLIDVNAASQAVDRIESVQREEERARKREELKAILGAEGTIPAARTEAPVPAARQDASIEGRLTTLKRLRDKALITEEEYDRKRKQILDEF